MATFRHTKKDRGFYLFLFYSEENVTHSQFDAIKMEKAPGKDAGRKRKQY